MMGDMDLMTARLHLRYDDCLDVGSKTDYKAFTPDCFEYGILWISSDALAEAAFMKIYGRSAV